jgi:hypothetical protein
MIIPYPETSSAHLSPSHSRIPQPNRQGNQRGICPNTQRCQHHHGIPTGFELLPAQPILPHLTEELPVAFVPPVHAHKQYAPSVCREEGSNAVELGREDLKHHQRKRELSQRCTDICPLKCSLCGAYLDESVQESGVSYVEETEGGERTLAR